MMATDTAHVLADPEFSRRLATEMVEQSATLRREARALREQATAKEQESDRLRAAARALDERA